MQFAALGAWVVSVADSDLTWDRNLPGCFGGVPPPFGGKFAQHPNDLTRALNWARSLGERRLGWPEAQRQIEAYLRTHKVAEARIEEEIQRAWVTLKSFFA